ncbi:dihydropteroate synthase [bacterium]|nr:dihydropteroate synthase [bacterium]
MDEVLVKFANNDIPLELDMIGFDKSYLFNVVNKYQGVAIKVKNLKPAEANILKQLCLSLGFDCAVNRGVITCKCEKTDCILFASIDGYKKLTEKLKKQPFRLKELSQKLYDALNNVLEPLRIRNYLFDWSRPYIMGILNITPDSFSDGGMYLEKEEALKHVISMIENGADIIDIGGESTRPNADIINADEEIKRVVPIIQIIRKENPDIPISIDTRNFITAKAAIEAGADIVNDVSGLDFDKNLFDYVVKNNVPTVIMHSTSIPATSINECSVEDIYVSLYNKIQRLITLGMSKSNIIADIGIGFGKSKEDCFNLLKRLDEFCSLGVPLLMGLSRKSFIKNQFDINNIDELDVVTALYSAMVSSKGANIHRVHNVKLTKQYLDLSSEIN